MAQTGQTTSSLANYTNRIEHRRIKWMAFHCPAFHLYYPQGGDSLAAFVATRLPGAQALVSKRLGSGGPSAPQIIIYPSLETRHESSIGSRETAPLKLPTFISRGSRTVLHYTGNYQELEDQLYLALTRTAWKKALQRTSLSAQANSSAGKETVPFWFSEGTQHWFALGWLPQQDEQLRHLFQTDTPANFYELLNADPVLGGAGFCYYLSQAYLPTAPRRVFEQLRSGKSLERALRLVAKRRPDSLYASCYDWFRRRYHIPAARHQDTLLASDSMMSKPAGTRICLPTRKPVRVRVRQCLLSPDGNMLAEVLDVPGHRRAVYITDLKSGRARKVLRYDLPPWLADHRNEIYPLLHWESGQVLQVTHPVKGKLTVRRFTTAGETGTGIVLPNIDGATAVVPLGGESWLISAWLRGRSDLVRYATKGGRYLPLTNDAADDHEPALTGAAGANLEPIYFSSVRKGDTAFGQDTQSLYQGIYRRTAKGIEPVITDTLSYTSFRRPILVDQQRLQLQANVAGRSRIAVLDVDRIDQELRFVGDAAGQWQYLHPLRRIAAFDRQGDSIRMTATSIDSVLASGNPALTDTAAGPWLVDYRRAEALRKAEDSILRAARAASGPSLLDGVFKAAQGQSRTTVADSTANQFHPKKAAPYIVQLYSAYFSTQVNNDYFINRFQPYQAFQGSFKVPDVGGMASAGLSDLFENHHLSFAYRLPAGSEGSMFYAKYGNTAKRLDWSLAYFRNVESIRPDPARAWVDDEGRPYPGAAKVKTHYYELGMHYPLSYYSSIGGTIAARKDRTVFLATNSYSLTYPALSEFWLSAHPWIETKHLRPTIAGLYRGWQAKGRADVFKTFTGSEAALAGLGMSAQWHQPLYKYITLVTKAQAGYSAGDRKMLYVLGGVDNNLTPRIDSTVHFSQAAPYAYQTLVTPLRGYLQNSLYGSRYALINADVYAPIFETLLPIETAFPSINHLQIGLFSDLATAGGEQAYSTAAKGWRWSYGFSARTVLAGYPLRFDMAWPGSFSDKPIWYLSLSL